MASLNMVASRVGCIDVTIIGQALLLFEQRGNRPGVFFNTPVIDRAWKGRFFSTRGTTASRRGGISLLTIALEFLALLLLCGKRDTPLSRRTATLPRQGFLTGRRYCLQNAAWHVKRVSKSL
jgi:hypothetical protein